MDYFIDYNTGAGNESIKGTLEDAKKLAESNLSYTQKDVTISANGEEAARLIWYGVSPQEGDFVTANYGDFGFYGGWLQY